MKPFNRLMPSAGASEIKDDLPRAADARHALSGDGGFSFHQDIDISAPNGSPVYAVADGTVVRVTHEWVRVDCGNGRAFEYWHLESRVHLGQRVEAGQTLIGNVRRPQQHVHLTQLQDGHAVNPVAPGRLAPYRDTTSPRVVDIAVRQSEIGPDEMPQFVQGRVLLVAEAVDEPACRPGIWHDLPVTPARISWRIEVDGPRDRRGAPRA